MIHSHHKKRLAKIHSSLLLCTIFFPFRSINSNNTAKDYHLCLFKPTVNDWLYKYRLVDSLAVGVKSQPPDLLKWCVRACFRSFKTTHRTREALCYKHILMGHTLTMCVWQYLTEPLCGIVFSCSYSLDLFCMHMCVYLCVYVHVVALVLLGTAGAPRMHSLVGSGTGRQLNRSAWGNLDWPAGGGRHTAGGSRTGENSNTSDGHALCYTGRHWGTHMHRHAHTHIHSHSQKERCTSTPAAGQQERKMIKKLESWGERAILTLTLNLNAWNYTNRISIFSQCWLKK